MGRAKEARRGEARQQQGRSRIRLDHPSCFPAQPSPSVRPSVLVRPQPLCPVLVGLSLSTERDCLTD